MGYNIKRSGYTLVELMIVFLVIGIVSLVGITTAKPYKKQMYHLYSKAYDLLFTASYNVFADENPDYDLTTPKRLCKGLIKYINSNKYISDGKTEPCSVNDNDTTKNRASAPHW